MSSCSREVYTDTKEYNGDFSVKAEIYKTKYVEYEDPDRKVTFVYGNLVINGEGKRLKAFDINCILIGSNELKSFGIYADSIGSTIIRGYEAVESRIDIDVYWVFDGKLSLNELAQFHIIFPAAQAISCVEFE